MKTLTARRVEDALTKFDLIAGVGSESERQACAMTLLAWLAGEEWADHPSCAHPAIAGLVIAANDAPEATEKSRAELVRAGREGVLDTWWIPGVLLVAAQLREAGSGELSHHERAVGVLSFIADWKKDRQRPDLLSNLRSADLGYANLRYANLRYANLRYADLGYANLRSADLRYANLRYADLGYANLRSADLRYANLRYADLGSADLGSANLRYANLGYAIGMPLSGMPDGWKLNEAGLWVKS